MRARQGQARIESLFGTAGQAAETVLEKAGELSERAGEAAQKAGRKAGQASRRAGAR